MKYDAAACNLHERSSTQSSTNDTETHREVKSFILCTAATGSIVFSVGAKPLSAGSRPCAIQRFSFSTNDCLLLPLE